MAAENLFTRQRRALPRSSAHLGTYRFTPQSGSAPQRHQEPAVSIAADAGQDSASLESTYGLLPASKAITTYNTSSSSSERSYTGGNVGEDEIVSIRLPQNLRSDTQTREQMMQRFYDLHIGDSNTARRVFAFEALDIISPSKSATKAAMDTLSVSSLFVKLIVTQLLT